MPEAPQAPSDPLLALVGSARSRAAERPADPHAPAGQSVAPRVAVVLAAGRSERLGHVTGGGSKALVRLGDAALVAGLAIWALHGSSLGPETVLVLAVAATGGSLLSMASTDRAAALGLPAAPERRIGWLLGGRDGRLLLIAVAAIAASPVAALLAVTATSLLALAIRVAFLRRRG
jgi:hypothetical protein